jgi:RNA polymerase sigma-70 factor (ECF subfamily)
MPRDGEGVCIDETHSEPTDEALAKEAQSGSLDAFEVLVTRYEGKIYGFIRHSCTREADAADVAQTTFVTAFQKLNHYDSDRPFAPWLFTIARRKLIDFGRRSPMNCIPELPEMVDDRDPATILDGREQQQSIWHTARRCLSEDQYAAVWLRYREDLSVVDVARVLRWSRTRAKVVLHRARRKLVGLLSSHQPPSDNQPGKVSRSFRQSELSNCPVKGGSAPPRIAGTQALETI